MKILTFNAQAGISAVSRLGWCLKSPEYIFPHSHKALKDLGKVLAEEKIDIVTLTELEGKSFRSAWRSQLEAVSKSSGLRDYRFFPIKNERRLMVINQGNGILSRYPIRDTQTYYLPGGIEQRILAQTTLCINKTEVDVYVTHLSLGKRSRTRQLKEIIRLLQDSNRPYVLSGDFNLGDKHEAETAAERLNCIPIPCLNTSPSWAPKNPRDMIFLSKDFELKRAYTISRQLFSDHLPLVYEAELK